MYFFDSSLLAHNPYRYSTHIRNYSLNSTIWRLPHHSTKISQTKNEKAKLSTFFSYNYPFKKTFIYSPTQNNRNPAIKAHKKGPRKNKTQTSKPNTFPQKYVTEAIESELYTLPHPISAAKITLIEIKKSQQSALANKQTDTKTHF